MPTPSDPGKNESRGTYAAQYSEKELTRLAIQDRIVTAGMGGVLPEQADPTVFHRVLDVACGTGDWLIEAAQAYPTMLPLVGVDIGQRMIEHALAQAEAHQVNDRVEFRVMDALLILEFPTAYFDLVNLRFGASFLRTWDWPKTLSEMRRVTRPRGVVRVTESDNFYQSNSPALMQLCEMGQCAFFQSGHLFTQESRGVIDHLARLLTQHGCQQVQTKAHAIEYRAGTVEGQAYRENMELIFQTLRPFIQKWGCAAKDYETIYQQALHEMRQPDFLATLNVLTAWGVRGATASKFSSDL